MAYCFSNVTGCVIKTALEADFDVVLPETRMSWLGGGGVQCKVTINPVQSYMFHCSKEKIGSTSVSET